MTARGGDRSLEIVRDSQELAREIRDRVFTRLLRRALRAPPRVFRIGERAQQAITQGRILGHERCDIHRFRCDGFVHVAMRHRYLVECLHSFGSTYRPMAVAVSP